MTCPREQEVLSATREGLEHAANCAECAESLRLLSGARAVIAAGRPPLSAESRARMWRQVETAGEQPHFGWPGFVPAALGAAIAAAVLLLIFKPADGEDGAPIKTTIAHSARPVNVRATSAAEIVRGGVTLSLGAGEVLELDTTPIALSSGELEVALEHGTSFELVTRDVRLSALGASFAIGVGRGTSIAVHAGTVRANETLLEAGKTATFGASRETSERAELETQPPLAAPTAPPQKSVTGAELAEPTPPAEPPPEAPAPIHKDGEKDEDGEKNGADHRPGEADRELDAIALQADVLRRAGRLDEAAALYLALAGRSDAGEYAEEALYRAARILRELGRGEDARLRLGEARRRFPNGPLTPERTALEEALDGEIKK